jgi:hypothetical protein
MQILRFEEATPTAPKRKKSSKGYLTAGFVAALFSVGSAFATSSISINSGSVIGLGQGVAKVTGCDPAITVTPHTRLIGVGETLDFVVDYIDILDINSSVTDATTGLGCLDKDIEVKFYDNFTTPGTPVALTCEQLEFDQVVFQDNVGVTATNQKCTTDAVYFRVGALGYRILVNDLDPALFDNITLVSTYLGETGTAYPAT